ncbi:MULTISPECIES: NAD-dependent 4,6-dehydratase LegB [Thalassospira]|jgi:NAD dependent epimerase/dehydratase|uniref:NAD-dependent 4,6-dehydratase LegB n=1 Tax=Thalassospira TaxID=168934 RepID=UPI0007A5BBAE|nr:MULTISPECIES: NAD-dependent 4,6-dehydratase LegB [unclassified Thalassospira]KZC99056.1 NAD-dependent dehydratase [Thalassospira sp. MCCC 1A02898]ONH88647.1 NAD-dependent dehydratase [Thalassospira sp. MCCC 1A02803]BDW90354.1 NAD-dependent dehydratase [Thalassospira tepidiphila]
MKLSNKKILVTGADGFIGSHLVEALVRSGHDVRAFAMYNSIGAWGWLDNCENEITSRIEVVLGDIRDAGSVRDAVKGCDVVLHLAALIAIPYSYSAPASYVDTNVHGTLNVLQAARDFGVDRVVCTSTSEVYGTAKFVPITEEHPLQGQSPYSASKIGADMIALSFHASFDLPVTLLRPFNTFGPRQSARAVIPAIVSQVASGAKEVKLGSLAPTRDFTYVTDTAKGFVLAAACDDLIGSVTNIGTGYEISIGELAGAIIELMGRSEEVQVVCDEQRLRPEKSEVDRLCAGVLKAEKYMDWNPEFSGATGLRKGLLKTIEWFSNPKNLSLYKTDRYVI